MAEVKINVLKPDSRFHTVVDISDVFAVVERETIKVFLKNETSTICASLTLPEDIADKMATAIQEAR